MLGYLDARGCRMEFLRRELDDPAAARCGRCDNCTGSHWPAAVSAAGVTAAGERLLRPGVEIEPRRMWPAGMRELGVEVSGKIPAGLAAEPGRALGRLTDLGWGPQLRAVLATGATGQPGPGGTGSGGTVPAALVPVDVIEALVKVLAAWDWAQRPAAVVTLPSRSHPGLVANLGQRIAGIGRLPYLGALGYDDQGCDGDPGSRGPAAVTADGARSGRQHNSAQRLRAVWRELRMPAGLGAAVARLGAPVLLIDDRIETGWTMTVAAKLVKEAGAPAVLPLALAVTAG